MKLRDLKIGTKLYSGFIIILILTAVVGSIAYRSISDIIYQIEISKIVNRIIVDAGDAQAGSLRYIIYDDDKYYKIVEEESQNIKDQSVQVKELLLSLKNKQVSEEIYDAINSYSEDNVNFYKLQLEKKEVHKDWVKAAHDATNQVIEVIKAAKAYSMANKDDYSAVERVLMVQNARNSINRMRISANMYIGDPNEEYDRRLVKELNEIRGIFYEAEKIMASDKTKNAMVNALTSIENYESQFNKYKDIIKKQQAIQANQRTNATNLLKKARELRGGVYDFIDNTDTKAVSLLIIVLSLAIIIGFLIGTLITRSITIPLSKGVNFADQIANGDLTNKLVIDQKDEIGNLSQALNNMIAKLKEVISSVVSGAENISGASQQISSSSQQLSHGANEQASSVEEISSTLEEITANIQQNTDNAKQTEKISNEANESVKTVAERSQVAVEANKNIAEKITIINDIAFQTNILALNAAVEAARAGEHGKGFAVVAAEVRKLAERSKVAAEEIVDLAQKSLDLSQQAGNNMTETIPKIENTTKLVQEISAASTEQSNGTEQVNNSVQQLNSLTQQNAAASEEMATSSEELASQADELKRVVAFFKTDELANSKSNIFNQKNKLVQNQLITEKKTEVKNKNNGSGTLINMNAENLNKIDDEFEKF